LESELLQNYKKSYSEVGWRKQDVIYFVTVRKSAERASRYVGMS
jgi:hypothetical protein